MLYFLGIKGDQKKGMPTKIIISKAAIIVINDAK